MEKVNEELGNRFEEQINEVDKNLVKEFEKLWDLQLAQWSSISRRFHLLSFLVKKGHTNLAEKIDNGFRDYYKIVESKINTLFPALNEIDKKLLQTKIEVLSGQEAMLKELDAIDIEIESVRNKVSETFRNSSFAFMTINNH